MSKYTIKICRINDVHTARFLARCKIDFIGLHAIFGLPNKKQLSEFQNIIHELKEYYPKTKTVLVTRIVNPDKLLDVYKDMPTDFVQWSAPVGKVEKKYFLSCAKKIKPNVKLFNVLSSTEGDISLSHKNIVGKYVLIDKKFAGGTGVLTPKEELVGLTEMLKNKYILIAGGMGRVNINSWLSGINVAGVDIMSSMEISKSDKRKNIKKIAHYLKQTRNYTELPILDISSKKQLVYKKISTIRDAKTAIARGVDFLLIERKASNKKIFAEIQSINPFIPIMTMFPPKATFL